MDDKWGYPHDLGNPHKIGYTWSQIENGQQANALVTQATNMSGNFVFSFSPSNEKHSNILSFISWT